MTFDQVLAGRTIHPVFQPIVCIDDGEIVGFEALARGPAGSPWAAPAALFAEAYCAGKASELDWVCRVAATRVFADAGMPESVAAALGRHRRVVLEITERCVAKDPAGMLAAVEDTRRDAIGVALDDVGIEPASVAMMPLIRPDVIKLDLTVIQGRTNRAVARIVNAVMAEAERTGAAILAEGIESDRQVRVAQTMGATLGQGWYFGTPNPSPAPPPAPRHPIDLLPAVDTTQPSTPFGAIRGRRLSQGTEPLLRPLSLHLEYRGLDATDPTVVLACFQDVERFGEPTRRRYAQLAERGVFTAVLGRNMPPEPVPGIRGARLDPADPIAREWTVIVLGSHFAAGLLAKERDGEAGDGVFDFVVTHDRDVVIAAARPLLKRILATDG